MKRRVVIGMLGTVLDKRGKRGGRWKRWRPTLASCRQPEMPVDRLELLCQPHSVTMAEQLREDVAEISPATEVRLHPLALENAWDFEEVYRALLDFASDYPFDTENEEYLVHITTGTHVVQICWFLLTEARRLPGKLLQTSPAPRDQGMVDPLGRVEVIDLDLSRYATLTRRFLQEQQQSVSLLKGGIATRNPAFNTLIEQIERVALRSEAPILLSGPTGAGKSFLARRIYQLRQARHRVSGQLVAVNCATLRGDNAMSTLFGHVRGAFTGAQQARNGLLREADGGVLFLDEIAELGLDEQAMLLKAIEEKRFLPLGGDREVSSDFQLIAGTHRDLRQWVAEGRFRADLWARINLWSFTLPGLAERPEDIEPNLEYELLQFAQQQIQVRFEPDARARYLAFACAPDARWRGNFRELNASVTRMATLADNGRITPVQVADEIARLRGDWQQYPQAGQDSLPQLQPVPTRLTPGLADDPLAADFLPVPPAVTRLIPELDLFERSQLESVLQVCMASATLSEAGRRLFAVSRRQKKQPNDADRLRKYLARFGLSWEMLSSGHYAR